MMEKITIEIYEIYEEKEDSSIKILISDQSGNYGLGNKLSEAVKDYKLMNKEGIDKRIIKVMLS